MKNLMDRLRNNPPKELAGYRVIQFRDYEKDTILDIDTGKVTPTGLPISNVLYFRTEPGDNIIIRPSGTEPKIKTYILVNGKDQDEVKAKIDAYSKVTETWTE